MEPLDVAYERFRTFIGEALPAYWTTIKTEADTRFKIIDKLFVHVLGWPEADVHLEEPAGEGRSDYRLTVGPLNRMIVEAKREGRDLGILEEHAGRAFKLNGEFQDGSRPRRDSPGHPLLRVSRLRVGLRD